MMQKPKNERVAGIPVLDSDPKLEHELIELEYHEGRQTTNLDSGSPLTKQRIVPTTVSDRLPVDQWSLGTPNAILRRAEQMKPYIASPARDEIALALSSLLYVGATLQGGWFDRMTAIKDISKLLCERGFNIGKGMVHFAIQHGLNCGLIELSTNRNQDLITMRELSDVQIMDRLRAFSQKFDEWSQLTLRGFAIRLEPLSGGGLRSTR